MTQPTLTKSEHFDDNLDQLQEIVVGEATISLLTKDGRRMTVKRDYLAQICETISAMGENRIKKLRQTYTSGCVPCSQQTWKPDKSKRDVE